MKAACDKWQHSYWRCSICLSKAVTKTPIEKGSTLLSIEHCQLTAHKNYSEKHWIFNSAVNITVNSGSCSAKVSTTWSCQAPNPGQHLPPVAIPSHCTPLAPAVHSEQGWDQTTSVPWDPHRPQPALIGSLSQPGPSHSRINRIITESALLFDAIALTTTTQALLLP